MKYLIHDQINTERLLLRRFINDDWKDLFHYYNDPECMKYTAGKPLTEGETWRTMATMIGHWELRKYGPYAMVLKKTGNVIGPVGLWYPNDWPEPEIKWGLARTYWGKGYASEAVRAVLKMAADQVADMHLISQIHVDNQNSINLAKSVGATLEREHSFRGEPSYIFRHSIG